MHTPSLHLIKFNIPMHRFLQGPPFSIPSLQSAQIGAQHLI